MWGLAAGDWLSFDTGNSLLSVMEPIRIGRLSKMPKAVTMTTGVHGRRAFMVSTKSNPSMPGMRMSVYTIQKPVSAFLVQVAAHVGPGTAGQCHTPGPDPVPPARP